MNAICSSPIPSTGLPHVPVGELLLQESRQRWLIEDLWAYSGVGFLCALPKQGKSWLGLDIAVSVASGTPCLGRFPVCDQGPVLVYLAEDSLPALRERVEGIARQRGLSLEDLQIHVITAPSLKLDLLQDRSRLTATLSDLRPRLLVLDPLVRLHNLNENDSQAISELLSYLRDLQRSFDLSVLLVHHARKNGGAGSQGGQGLRGSGDFWAWSDTNLFLRRVRGNLQLSMEHRSAPSPEPVYLKLEVDDPTRIHLEVSDSPQHQREWESPLSQRVLEELNGLEAMTRKALREKLSVKNERLGQALRDLENEGKIERSEKGGYSLLS